MREESDTEPSVVPIASNAKKTIDMRDTLMTEQAETDCPTLVCCPTLTDDQVSLKSIKVTAGDLSAASRPPSLTRVDACCKSFQVSTLTAGNCLEGEDQHLVGEIIEEI